MRRRWCEHELGVFPWRDLFQGRMLDVGAGSDPLPFDNVTAFDQAQGDANHLADYFEPESFDLIHASQVLEHLHDAQQCLKEWLTLLRPGGYIVATVPDWVAYEGMTFPSRWNGDHKASFSMIYRGSTAPKHFHVPTMLDSLGCNIVLAHFVDTNYDYSLGTVKDQTFVETDQVECWNEFVLQKL